MTGLQKATLEIPLVAGLTQQIAAEVAPPGALYDLTNAEIDTVGNVRRRTGHKAMSRAAFNVGTNSVSSTVGTPLKVGGRRDEVWIITSDSYYLGSGGGSGSAGEMLWTYSPELDAWKPHTKVPRPTLERWGGLSNSGNAPESASIGFGSSGGRELIVVSYVVLNTDQGASPGVHAVVFDATSRAIIVEDTILDDVADIAFVTAFGDKIVVTWRGVFSPAVKFSVFSITNPEDGFSEPAFLLPDVLDGTYYSQGTDGTSFFVLYDHGTDWKLARFDTTLASTGSVDIEVAGGVTAGSGIYYAGGRLHMAFGTTTRCRYASITPALTDPVGPTSVNDFAPTGVCIAATSVSQAIVIYSRVASPAIGPVIGTSVAEMFWREISDGDSLPILGVEHETINMQPVSEPFAFANRVFLPVTGVDLENEFRTTVGPGSYTGYGHALVELSRDTGDGSVYQTPFPCASWSRDASRANSFARFGVSLSYPITSGSFGVDSDRYLTTLRLVRNVDKFNSGARDPGGGAGDDPVKDDTGAYGIDIIRLAFDDRKRWAHAELASTVTIASAIPFTYDSSVAHECGHVWRPEILGSIDGDVGSGAYNTGDEILYEACYCWEDVNGDRWFSDMSYQITHTMENDGRGVQLCIRLPNLTAKPLGGSNFSGKPKIILYRSRPQYREDFRKVDEVYCTPWSLSNITMFDTGADDLQDTERAYTVGGELSNSLAPPCRALVQHNARLICISTDDGKLWMTKEKRFQRGIEWSAYLTMTLPQKGMALASVEGALIVLCERSIYITEGTGPDALGQPPDGFGKLSLLSLDKGCSEYNAAWRTPVGVIYRGYQGLWLINQSLGFSFIGEAVTDFTDLVARYVDGVLDTRHGRLRLLCLLLSGQYRVLNFWYDTKRWSIDTIETNEQVQYSSAVVNGELYRAVSGFVYKNDPARWNDNNAFPLYLMSVRTGWIRMGGMPEFKRVWRALANVGRVRGETQNPILDVRVTVETELGVSVQKTFKAKEFPPLGDWTIRTHLAKQKGKFFRVTLEEQNNENTMSEDEEGSPTIGNPPGFTFSSIGLEYAVKRGAAKLPSGRSK